MSWRKRCFLPLTLTLSPEGREDVRSTSVSLTAPYTMLRMVPLPRGFAAGEDPRAVRVRRNARILHHVSRGGGLPALRHC